MVSKPWYSPKTEKKFEIYLVVQAVIRNHTHRATHKTKLKQILFKGIPSTLHFQNLLIIATV